MIYRNDATAVTADTFRPISICLWPQCHIDHTVLNTT